MIGKLLFVIYILMTLIYVSNNWKETRQARFDWTTIAIIGIDAVIVLIIAMTWSVEA